MPTWKPCWCQSNPLRGKSETATTVQSQGGRKSLKRTCRSILAMAAALVAFLPPLGHAFTTSVLISTSNFIELRATGGGDGSYSEENLASDGGKVQDFGEEDLQVAGVMLEDLSWRVEKLRLEEENIRRFLKAKARFLPYEECRKWVHAFNRWSTEQEWKDWIEMGEKRNSYIPSRPDEYYTDTGDWISWDHFLGVDAEGITEAQEND